MTTLSKRWISDFTTLAFLSTSLVPVAPAAAGKTVKHTLDTEVTYAEGIFEHGKDGTSRYTRPHEPQKAPTQSVKIYDGNPKQMSYEKLLIRVVSGKDGRQRIEKTTEWPYRFHSQLSMHFPSGEYGGSGILVGPQHLLTAAHNVYDPDKKEWATHIIVRLGLNDAMVPFGDLKAMQAYTFEDWIDRKDPNFDMALITLNQPIGLKVGWSGLLCLEDIDLLSEDVHVTGYPGDKGLKQMWTMSHIIKKVEPERIFYEIDTYPGQSGSGIWINKWGNPYTVGIHTLGERGKYEGNSGVRLSQGKFTQILTEWISKTRDIQEPILKQPSFIKRRQDSLSNANNMSKIAKKNEDVFNKSTEPVILPVKPQPKADVPPTQSFTMEELLEKGDTFFSANNFQEALKCYQLATDKGCVKACAQNRIGFLYSHGKGVKQDYAKAMLWYQKAAAQGYATAQNNIGVLYHYGYGVEQDNTKALAWFQKAAAQEDALAQANIRLLYEKRFGVLPAIVYGYEEIYQRFLKGKLIYRPNEGSDAGKIELPIASLANPLEGTFDLSCCGDTKKYLSIATGYRKGKLAENADKVEIWLSPRFLIEKEISSASHFKAIMGTWNATIAPIGVFFTWGDWDNLNWYDYATTSKPEYFNNHTLYKIWENAEFNHTSLISLRHPSTIQVAYSKQKFHVHFELKQDFEQEQD